MQVCVPTRGDGGLDADVSHHLGRAPTYTVYDTETGSVDVYDNDSDHRGGSGSPPETVADIGADTLVCVHVGARASDQLHAMDISVYCGADGTVREAVQRFQDGDLERELPGDDTCRGDHEHGDDHGHSHEHDGGEQ